jgi:hypothetical protein
MDDFRPDQWRRLSRRLPSGFEARRRAVLLLELTRIGPPPNARARQALERMERQLSGQDASARLQTATQCLMEAMADLGHAVNGLLRLGTELDRAVALDLNRARPWPGKPRARSGPPTRAQAARLRTLALALPSSDSISRRNR